MSVKGFFRNVFLAALGVTAVVLVSGCGQGATNTVTVTGVLDLGGADALPEKSTARISIFEQRPGGGEKRIVAERTLHDLESKSIKFTVDIERDLIDPDGDYRLRGEILSADGAILWHSENVRQISPSQAESEVRLELVPNASDADLSFEQFRCDDGFHFVAAIRPERVVVRLGNRRLGMPATERSDTFQGEHGNQLVRNDQAIEVRIDDSAHKNCSAVANQSPPATDEAPSGPQTEPSSPGKNEHETSAGQERAEQDTSN